MDLRYLQCVFFLLAMVFNKVSSSFPAPAYHPKECVALSKFFNSFKAGEPERRECTQKNWTSVDCCSWTGVECDYSTRHVAGINLSPSCVVQGTLSSSSSLFQLSSLRRLSLAGIDLEQSLIPAKFGVFRNLTSLQLRNCNLSGSVPTALCKLKELRGLDLFNNQLTGKMPACILALPNLEFLDLSQNFLQGSLPSTINISLSLLELTLNNNSFDGKVPAWLFTIPTLTNLYLHRNNLTGPIESFGRLTATSLMIITLNNNRISGCIPQTLIHENSVTVLYSSFCYLGDLRRIDLSFNNLTGVVPPCLLNNDVLQLKLEGNHFDNSTTCRFHDQLKEDNSSPDSGAH